MTKNYPLYVFEKCGCEIESQNIIKNKNLTVTCPKHKTKLLKRIGICKKCGKEFDADTQGYMPEYDKEHKKEYNRERQLAYYRAKRDNNLTDFYKKWGNRIMKTAAIEKPNLRPNPVITNALRPPCNQGCSFKQHDKNKEPCLSCSYALAYAELIAASFMPAPGAGLDNNTRRSNQRYAAAICCER